MDTKSPPTWEELRILESENARLAALSPHDRMIDDFGEKLDATCGQCRHLVDKADYQRMRPGHYFKCLIFSKEINGALGGPKTDWRKRFAACGKFEASHA